MTNTQRQANMQKDSLGANAKDAQFEQRISVKIKVFYRNKIPDLRKSAILRIAKFRLITSLQKILLAYDYFKNIYY